jgi:glyceraldehyde 3-phosphate dehydrogenase
MINIAVNGFGRIGRSIVKLLLASNLYDIVAINSHDSNTKRMAYLFKYDSTHGVYHKEVEHNKDHIIVNGKEIKTLFENNIHALNWRELNIDIVIECSGSFNDFESAKMHICSGAKRVVISAPSTANVLTVVMGVNDHLVDKHFDSVVSNASCTTNCLALMLKVLHDEYTVVKGFFSTIHAYTRDQKIVDSTHNDLRRTRAAAVSIIPTSTGAAKNIDKVIPKLKGKIGGSSYRVPVLDGSIVDLVVETGKEIPGRENINSLFKYNAEEKMKGILEYIEDPIVSVDIIGNTHSCIIDSELTSMIDSNFIKVCGWYDNEWGYANRCVELVEKVSKTL